MAENADMNEEIEESVEQGSADVPEGQAAETLLEDSAIVAESEGTDGTGEAHDDVAEDDGEIMVDDTEEDLSEFIADDTEADTGENEGERVECKNSSNVVGIRFPNSGKTYCFCAGDLKLSRYDRVVVESELGINIGQVAKVSCEMIKVSDKGLKPVLRKVTEVDLQQEAENDAVKKEAREYAVERIKERKLPMKLLYADVTLDRKRFIFYFVADTRIDFRELVKDLASKFRTRIELRQIGVRDAAKMIGGFGICGQELCCKTWLKGFAPISIKMAKQQDLVLNTCKLSGVCGRLMCCLNYEYDPSGPRRRKPEPRQKEKPSEAVMEKAIESAIGAGVAQRVETPARVKDEASLVERPAEAPRQEKREQAGDSAERKKRKRRRGGRNRNRQDRPSDGAPRAAAEARDTSQREAAAAPSGGQAVTGQDASGGQARKDKPRRPRRRRRKPKENKPE